MRLLIGTLHLGPQADEEVTYMEPLSRESGWCKGPEAGKTVRPTANPIKNKTKPKTKNVGGKPR